MAHAPRRHEPGRELVPCGAVQLCESAPLCESVPYARVPYERVPYEIVPYESIPRCEPAQKSAPA
jgi:hypothetical protein